MSLEDFVYAINNFYFIYMFAYSIIFFITTVVASINLNDLFIRSEHLDNTMLVNHENYIPISILVPAYNEEITIIDTIESLLHLDYPEFEIIVINDGSKDLTKNKVINHFKLKKIDRPFRKRLVSKKINGIYENMDKINIVLVDKENGGKSDALNLGLNISRFPLFVCVDADSMLQYDSLSRIVQPFLEDDKVIAVGGNIKVSNGMLIKEGKVVEINEPKKWIVKFQMVEYLRVFLNSRVAFNKINANIIVSGAFGIYQKQAVIDIGGYNTSTIGEDMELIVKLHAFFKKNKKPYRIAYVSDAVCWTQVPESYKILRGQRRRWHIGMGQSLINYRFMFLNPKYGAVGLIAYPYFLLFEFITPIFEILGLFTISISYLFSLIKLDFFLIYLLVYMGYSIICSTISILVEKYLFDRIIPSKLVLKLILFSVFECFGYRQLCSLYRIEALGKLRSQQWGNMTRIKQHQQG
ncbi:MAG: glycosyltransferase family 2 protein [Clostridiales bacterium]|nr:glycosyltransferase family 2 protein [Clostridiales bacterium]